MNQNSRETENQMDRHGKKRTRPKRPSDAVYASGVTVDPRTYAYRGGWEATVLRPPSFMGQFVKVS